MLPRRFSASALSLALTIATFCCSQAFAATLSVDPTRLSFSTMTSGDILLTDFGHEPLRISVRAYAWKQNTGNVEILSPTKHVAYFPQILTLAPGASARIRVGVLDSPGPAERAYRLIVTQLPAFDQALPTHAPAIGLTFLSRVDIPMFLSAGVREQPTPRLAGLKVHGDALSVILANQGNAHVEQSALSIAGIDARGRRIWEQRLPVFYVLADSEIDADADVSGDELRNTRLVSVTWRYAGSILASRRYALHF